MAFLQNYGKLIELELGLAINFNMTPQRDPTYDVNPLISVNEMDISNTKIRINSINV
jgi:hypothetical protein